MSLRDFAQYLDLQHYETNYYAMIACYLDESVDPKKEGIFAVGGMIGRGRPFFELERRWEALRKQPEVGIEYFKASECQSGKKQFRKFVVDPDNITADERTRLDNMWDQFLEIMLGDTHEAAIVFGIGVVQEDFYEVIKDPKAHAVLGDSPYWFAYQSAMIEAAFAMKTINTGDCVAFVCDEDEEHSPIAHDVYREVKRKNPNAARYMGTFSTASDHMCEPLQAADAAIYEVRRGLHVSLGRWRESLKWGHTTRWQFKKLGDAHRLWMIQYADKNFLQEVVRENMPGEPLNLDHFLTQEFPEDVKVGI
jgi:hypothetical protein